MRWSKAFSRKNEEGVEMKIPSWMIIAYMKLIENYRMYAEAFGVDVPTTQSRLIESTRRTHRTTSALRTPNPNVNEGESKFNEDIIQLSIAKQKSLDDLEAKKNEEKVKEHLIAEEIEKMVEGTKNVENDEVVNYVLNNQEIPGTRLDPRSYKESLEVEIVADAPVNIIEEEEESTENVYELRQREKGNHGEESRNTPSPTTIRSPMIQSTLISLDIKKLQELIETDPKHSSYTPSSSLPKPTLSMEIVEQHPANFEETRALYDSLYQNLAVEVEKVNSVNRKLKETNADLTTELARDDGEHLMLLNAREKIITWRANGSIVSIIKADYKNLNKNDIEDMYLLCINGKV
nr:hypothetical protein [Tanacetum cinerariifolium]